MLNEEQILIEMIYYNSKIEVYKLELFSYAFIILFEFFLFMNIEKMSFENVI